MYEGVKQPLAPQEENVNVFNPTPRRNCQMSQGRQLSELPNRQDSWDLKRECIAISCELKLLPRKSPPAPKQGKILCSGMYAVGLEDILVYFRNSDCICTALLISCISGLEDPQGKGMGRNGKPGRKAEKETIRGTNRKSGMCKKARLFCKLF